MKLKKQLKFRYKDVPQDLLCMACKNVCQNPKQEMPEDPESSDDCDNFKHEFRRGFQSQILYFTLIQCEFCGQNQKYFRYQTHTNMCKLIFEKSQFISKFSQIDNEDIKCFICNQPPYRPQINEENQLICLSCLLQRNILNAKDLSNQQQKQIDRILVQCDFTICKKQIKIKNALKHYWKCQFKHSDLIKSEDYLQLLCLDNKYQQFKEKYKMHDISLKYQQKLNFNIAKTIYDCQKAVLVKKQQMQKIRKLRNYLKEMVDKNDQADLQN